MWLRFFFQNDCKYSFFWLNFLNPKIDFKRICQENLFFFKKFPVHAEQTLMDFEAGTESLESTQILKAVANSITCPSFSLKGGERGC